MAHVYIAPLGMSYGSLYSGIVLTKPDVVLILASEESALKAPIAIDAAGKAHPDFVYEVSVLGDPFTGFAEGRAWARRTANMMEAKGETNVTVCLTGGTTALQDAVKCVADLLNAREVALVDRRPVQEQRANPLVVGELVEIPPLNRLSLL